MDHYPSPNNSKHLQMTTLLASWVNQANENLLEIKLCGCEQPPTLLNILYLIYHKFNMF